MGGRKYRGEKVLGGKSIGGNKVEVGGDGI